MSESKMSDVRYILKKKEERIISSLPKISDVRYTMIGPDPCMLHFPIRNYLTYPDSPKYLYFTISLGLGR